MREMTYRDIDARREWLVIENSGSYSVFADDGAKNRKGYIPRDVVEGELGIKIEDGRWQWFTASQGEAMRGRPEWRNNENEF